MHATSTDVLGTYFDLNGWGATLWRALFVSFFISFSFTVCVRFYYYYFNLFIFLLLLLLL